MKKAINRSKFIILAVTVLLVSALPRQVAYGAPQQTAVHSPNDALDTPRQPQTGPDQDGDWVSDADEQRFGSDPARVDTDGDGMSDFEEIFIFHTVPDQADMDSDGDGFADQVEEELFHTDPAQMDADQDGDLLPDDAEIALGTDPKQVDSDQDLLSDLVELFLLKSDPHKVDIDQDRNGYPDTLEAWLPQPLQRSVCRADVTLTVDKLTVVDPEEADSSSNLVGGDETTVAYAIQVTPLHQPVKPFANGVYDGDLWNGDAYDGDEFTNFRALGPFQATCGETISVLLMATESDQFFGQTKMGVLQLDIPLAFQRLPVAWDNLGPTEHVFEGKGVDGTYEYDLIYTLNVALGGKQVTGLPTIEGEQPVLVDSSTTPITCRADGIMPAIPTANQQQNTVETSAPYKRFHFIEEFDNNESEWQVGSYSGTEISNGSLGYNADKLSPGNHYYWYPRSFNHYETLKAATQNDFHIEVTFFDFATAPDPDNFLVILQVRSTDTGAVTNSYEIGNDNQWLFYDIVDGKEEMTTGHLPPAINLLDGKSHTMRWEVTNHTGHSSHTLLVDGVEVVTLERDLELHGNPLFGFGNSKPKEKNRTASVRIDRFTVTAIGGELQAGTGAGPLMEESLLSNQRFTMQHPAGWTAAPQVDPTSQSPNGVVNTVDLFNSAGGYLGAANEMALTVYEPVYVMETAGFIDSTKAELAEVLSAFVKTELNDMPRSKRPKLSTIEQITVCDTPLVHTTVQVDADAVTWVASRNSDETVTITKIRLPAAQAADLLATPLTMISSLNYVAPPRSVRDLDGPAVAAKEFMSTMTQGNLDDAINLICTPERLFFSMADFFLSDMFDTNVIENLALEGYQLDDSYRYYETVWTGKDEEGDESAFVRISGHIVHIHPDGKQYIVAQSRAPIFGRSTVIRVEKENNVWRVCQGMKFKW